MSWLHRHKFLVSIDGGIKAYKGLFNLSSKADCSSHWTIWRCRIHEWSANTNRMENRKSISFCFVVIILLSGGSTCSYCGGAEWEGSRGMITIFLYLLESYDLVSVYGFQLLQMAKIGVVPVIMMPVTSVVVTNSRCITRLHILLMNLLDPHMNGWLHGRF